jgi:hypothetical protein
LSWTLRRPQPAPQLLQLHLQSQSQSHHLPLLTHYGKEAECTGRDDQASLKKAETEKEQDELDVVIKPLTKSEKKRQHKVQAALLQLSVDSDEEVEYTTTKRYSLIPATIGCHHHMLIGSHKVKGI